MQELKNNYYKVLARKYRPKNFLSLYSQEVLVQTISNAIKYNRLAHAFLLTGIRGVGKTTSARIIAKTINCTSSFIQDDIVLPCEKCNNCTAFNEERHTDIIEMDGASHTGVGDIREIIDDVVYRPLLGRYKIYIIDEVHMLSTNAFNALLKVLEEPPEHVKFIFATTEIHKIPLTIISRCQKFDLKIFQVPALVELLKNICFNENISYENDSLSIIANNAGGSARDAISILDRVISYLDLKENKVIDANTIYQVIGIVDKLEIANMFDLLADSKLEELIALLNNFYEEGKDLVRLFQELLEMTGMIIKLKAIPDLKISYPDNILSICKKNAQHLELSSLSLIWQFLQKAIIELKNCSNQLLTAEIALIRLLYLTGLPDLSVLNNNTVLFVPKEVKVEYPITDFQSLVSLLQREGEIMLYHYLKEAKLVSFEKGNIEIENSRDINKNYNNKICNLLFEWTKERWNVIISDQRGSLSLEDEEINSTLMLKRNVENLSEIKMIQENFPGTKIKKIDNSKIEV